MISWDTNCLFESMKIGKTSHFFEKVSDMVYLEKVCEEIESNKERFLRECKETYIPLLKEEYDFDIDLETIKKEIDRFIQNKCPVSLKERGELKKELLKKLASLKGVKIGKGDFEILCHSKTGEHTVITHDENLFSLLINESKTLFLIEFIMHHKESLNEFNNGALKYLYYHCLKRYDFSLNQLKQKFGHIAGLHLYSRKNKILEFLDMIHPLQNRAIIPTSL